MTNNKTEGVEQAAKECAYLTVPRSERVIYDAFIAGAKWQEDRSAAPELYKALRSLTLSVMAHPDYTGEDNEEWTDLIETAEEALAKATT